MMGCVRFTYPCIHYTANERVFLDAMLPIKLSRITLKMSDLEEYEEVKRKREKAMETTASSATPHKTTRELPPPKSSKGVPRSSTPEQDSQ